MVCIQRQNYNILFVILVNLFIYNLILEIRNLSHEGKTLLNGKNYALMGILSIINESKSIYK